MKEMLLNDHAVSIMLYMKESYVNPEVFYHQIKGRVEHLPMQQAILEVNHWCHERVTYRPSDARTSSPLATVRTAYGRCGEEHPAGGRPLGPAGGLLPWCCAAVDTRHRDRLRATGGGLQDDGHWCSWRRGGAGAQPGMV